MIILMYSQFAIQIFVHVYIVRKFFDTLHVEATKDNIHDVRAALSLKITMEGYFRNKAYDYQQRYYGHCNTSTDIKEANFFGK